MAVDTLPRYADVVSATECLASAAHQTPVLTSRRIDERLGATFYFKAEHLQRVGAFKFRGAYNTMSRLRDSGCRAVLTFSSGNHAQAVALSARLLGMSATVVMPDDAPVNKIEATRGYGAEVILYDRDEVTREALGEQLSRERGLTIVHPYNHPHVIAGQGTATLELIEEVGELDWLLLPVGGGGLIAGACLVVEARSPDTRLVGVEPAAADDAARSFRTGTIQRVYNPETIADGARTPFVGELNFAIIRRVAHDIVTVDDPALLPAMRLIAENLKSIIEPTAALPIAAVMTGAVSVSGRVGIILSGGNITLDRLARMVADG